MSKHGLDPGWQGRLRARLREMGYATMEAWLADNPGLTYIELAERLGNEVAVPAGIVRIQFEEAKARGRLREAAMDSLPREIKDRLPSGWQKMSEYEASVSADQIERIIFLTASAFGFWAPHLDSVANKHPALAVWKALEQSYPPVGWKPSGPTDPLIVAAFEKGWPIRENDWENDGENDGVGSV